LRSGGTLDGVMRWIPVEQAVAPASSGESRGVSCCAARGGCASWRQRRAQVATACPIQGGAERQLQLRWASGAAA